MSNDHVDDRLFRRCPYCNEGWLDDSCDPNPYCLLYSERAQLRALVAELIEYMVDIDGCTRASHHYEGNEREALIVRAKELLGTP